MLTESCQTIRLFGKSIHPKGRFMQRLNTRFCLQTKAKVARRIPEGHLSKVAKEAGVSYDKLYAWFNKGKGLSYIELFVLARYLKMPIEFVLDDDKADDLVPPFPTTKYEGTVIRQRNAEPAPRPSNRKRKPVDKKPASID